MVKLLARGRRQPRAQQLTRMVKKFIRANFRINAAAQTATTAQPRATQFNPVQVAAAPGAHDPSTLLCPHSACPATTQPPQARTSNPAPHITGP